MQKGFTLIELLVVIAIIGILTSIVGVFVSGAKNKGNDAGIKQNLIQVRNRAEILYPIPPPSGGYGLTECLIPGSQACAEGFDNVVVCSLRSSGSTSIFDDPKISAYLQVLIGLSLSELDVKCVARGDLWAMSVKLRTTGSWCVDSTGAGRVGVIGSSDLCS